MLRQDSENRRRLAFFQQVAVIELDIEGFGQSNGRPIPAIAHAATVRLLPARFGSISRSVSPRPFQTLFAAFGLTGTNCATPNSVAFSSIHSKRSNRINEARNVVRTTGSTAASLLPDRKRDQILTRALHLGQIDALIVGNLEVLSRLHAQHPRQVVSVRSGDPGAARLHGIDEETAAGHVANVLSFAELPPARARNMFTMILQEIRQAVRLLLKNPSLTAIATLSLAIGIGANSALFSLTDALLLRPLAIARPGEVMTVVSDAVAFSSGGLSYPDYRDLREKSRAFSSTGSGLAAFQLYTVGLAPAATVQPQMRMGMLVSDNFFSAMGIEPVLGRAFTPDEAKVPGRDAIALLGYEQWVTQFGHDPGILGRTVRLNGIDFKIIGVTPESFFGMDIYVHPAFYAPLTMMRRLGTNAANPLEDRANRFLQVKGRLQPGISREQAQAELIGIAKNLEKAYPATNHNHSIAVQTELQARFQQDPYDSSLVVTLMALAGLVLLIACANVANLLLARARSRSREIAIRLAIGAGRWRLLRQLLIESAALSSLGGLLGLGFGYLGIRFLQTIQIPTDLPIVLMIRLDGRVLLFSLFDR